MKAARASLKKTQVEMAAALGLSLNAVRDYESGKSMPGAKALQAYAALGFEAAWLLTGKGPMRGEDEPARREALEWLHGASDGASIADIGPTSYAEPARQEQPHHRVEDDLAYVPYYRDVQASGGSGAIPANEVAQDFLAFRRRWIRQELGAKLEDLAVIRMAGESMEPTLKAGDVLLLDRHAALHQGDGIYVIRRRDRLQVKRLQFMAEKIRIKSDNPQYEVEEVGEVGEESPDFVLAGRVVWVGRKL